MTGCQPGPVAGDTRPLPELAMFGTLPIYWGEGGDVTDFLDPNGEQDWVRSFLEQDFELMPLDALEDDTLAEKRFLILVQPRPLAPSENVSLDRWVRAGGQVLLFADPMLTRHSSYSIGDPRRPQDVILLSPILTRWGLELRFDDRQPDVEKWVDVSDGRMPVRLAGQFGLLPDGGAGRCDLSGAGIMARCRIGKGRATLVADAAVLDSDDAGSVSADQRESLTKLIDESFSR